MIKASAQLHAKFTDNNICSSDLLKGKYNQVINVFLYKELWISEV